MRAGDRQDRARPLLPDAGSVSAFRRSGAALLLIALSGPFWNVILVPLPGVSLTVGRALIMLAAGLLALDLRRAPRPLPRVARAVWLLLGVLALLWTWTVANALVWGCRCAGDIAGFSELLAVVALAVLAGTFEPRLRPLLVLAIIAGAILAALLTIAGIDGLSAGAANPAAGVSRLAGPYGNPNYLAFAIGSAIPAAVVVLRLWRGHERAVLAAGVALLAVVLLLTYSRGGLLAVALGAVVVLVLAQRRGSRAQWGTIAAVAVVAAGAGALYPVFVEQRRESTSPGLAENLRALDRSGWDGIPQGLIPGGPTQMRNPAPDVLAVGADGPGQGVSRALPRANRGSSYELRFEARAVAGTQPLRFGLEDNVRGNGPAIGATTLGSAWRALRVRWVPAARSTYARLYIWAPAAGPGFQIRDVATTAQAPGKAPVTTMISAALAGNRLGELKARQVGTDARDVRSREVGVELALEAFASQPARGIGWGRFPEYSAANSAFRGLPTHNEYLRFLAELGIVGAGLLVLVGGIVASSFWRRRLDAMSLALLGMLVTGAIGLVFVNGLVAAAVTLPLGLAAALACARAGPRELAVSQEASALWPTGPRAGMRPAFALPVGVGSAVVMAIRRARAAAPRAAPARAPGAVEDLAGGLTQLKVAAPAAAPEGWTAWSRHAERRAAAVLAFLAARLRTRTPDAVEADAEVRSSDR